MYNPLLKGLSLIELMLVVTVLAILLSIGGPSFSDIITKHRLKGATDNIYGALHLARIEAIKRNKRISLNFHDGPPKDWCYAMNDIGVCDCTQKSACKLGDNKASILSGSEFSGVTLTSKFSFTKHTTSFNPVRGTANSGSITLNTDNYKTKVIVSSRGRIRICSADLSSFPSC